MIINLRNQFIPRQNEASDLPGGGSGPSQAPGGLMEALGNAYVGDGTESKPAPVDASPRASEAAAADADEPDGSEDQDDTPPPDEAGKPAEKTGDAADQPDGEEDDDDFPEIGKGADSKDEPDEKKFDEKEFDAETDRLSKGMKGEVGRRFKELRAELKTVKQAPAAPAITPEVQAQLERLKEIETENEGLRQRNKDLLSKRDVAAVLESEEYDRQVLAPTKEMEDIIVSMAQEIEIDPATLFAVILEKNPLAQDKAIDGLVPKLGIRGANRIAGFADRWKQLESTKQSMLGDAQKAMEEDRKSAESRSSEESAARRSRYQSSTKEAFTKYASRIPGFTDSSGQLTDLGTTTLAKVSSIDTESLTEGDMAYMSLTTQAFPALVKHVRALEKENSLLKAGKGAAPVGGAPRQAAKTPEESPDAPLTLEERMKAQAGAGGFTFQPGA